MKKSKKSDKADKADAVFTEAVERFERVEEAEREDRLLMEDDLRFVAGEQWPDEIIRARKADNRPCLTINRLPQFVAQVVGDARQNKPAVKVHPVDDGADVETADILEGLIRHIESASQATTAYLTGFEHAVTGGRGAWRIITERDHKDPFVQDIKIERITSPFACYFDPNAKRYDKSDGNWAFVVDWITKEAFEGLYPDETPDDWDADFGGNQCSGWIREDNLVRVAEYWRKKPEKCDIAMMQDGRRVKWEDVPPEEYGLVLETAETETYEIERYVLSGAGILSGPEIFPGEYIPVVPVFGPEEFVDNRTRNRSLIRYAKDPQRQYNYWQTTITEKVALAPRAPWVGTVNQFAGLERLWENANTENRAFLPFNPDPMSPGMPQRNQPAAINAAEMQQAAQAIDDLKATTGIHDASLGAQGNETSGRTILARQREGDVATFAWIDNLSRSIELTGRILVGIIPKVYDTTRVIRVLGEDGTATPTRINQPAMTERGPMLVNDLTTGKYDVTITVGPSYSTKRIEAADSMMAFIQAVPQAAQVSGDLIAKSMDWPGADAIAERLKKLLPPGMLDEDLTPDQQAMRDQAAQIEQRQQQMMQQEAQEALQLAKAEKVVDIESKQAKAARDVAETQQTEAETLRILNTPLY